MKQDEEMQDKKSTVVSDSNDSFKETVKSTIQEKSAKDSKIIVRFSKLMTSFKMISFESTSKSVFKLSSVSRLSSAFKSSFTFKFKSSSAIKSFKTKVISDKDFKEHSESTVDIKFNKDFKISSRTS